jgi:hypothetical protein
MLDLEQRPRLFLSLPRDLHSEVQDPQKDLEIAREVVAQGGDQEIVGQFITLRPGLR